MKLISDVRVLALGVSALMLGFSYGPASATTFDLTKGSTLGAGTYGNVDVETITSTEVSVTLTLTAGEVFAVTGAGDALNFDLTGNPDITAAISGLTSGFTATSTTSGQSIHSDGSGHWEYSIDCTSCGNGTSSPTLSGPLTFDITLAGGITAASFIANDDSNHFAADIGVPKNGGGFSTGVVTDVLAETPLPGAFMLFGTVLLGGLGASKWRKHCQSGPVSVLT